MTDPSRAATGVIAWATAIVATPLVVGLLDALPRSDLAAVPWLAPAAGGIVALACGAAAGRWLAAALRDRRLREALGAAALAMPAAGGTATLLLAAPAPSLPVLLALALAGPTWLAAMVVGREARAARWPVGLAVFVAADAVLAGSLFLPWPPASAALLAVVATLPLLAAAAVAWRDGDEAAGPIALLAAGAASLGVARVQGAEALVALAPLIGAGALLAVVRRPAPCPAAAAGNGPRLPPLAHQLAEGVLLLDAGERLLDWNLAAATLLGFEADPRGRPVGDLIAPLIGPGALPPLAGTGTRIMVERGRPLELTLADADEGNQLVLVRDVSLERGEATESARLARELRGTIEELLDARRTIDLQRAELERASLVDELTGVATRRALLERLRLETAQARRYSHPVAVVVIDIDDFASLNHDQGLGTGDAVLRELALRLRLRMREADFLGRLGGDSFGAVLPHTDERGAAVFAEAVLRRMVVRPIETSAGPLTITVSLGVALMRPGMDFDDESLLAAADEALASARRGGGNRIAFDRRHGLVRLEDVRRPVDTSDASVEDTSGA